MRALAFYRRNWRENERRIPTKGKQMRAKREALAATREIREISEKSELSKEEQRHLLPEKEFLYF